MKYTLLTQTQLFFLALVTGALGGLVNVAYNMYSTYTNLPIVLKDQTDSCVKVLNFENGHAFSCHDVDVLLRKYRVQSMKAPVKTRGSDGPSSVSEGTQNEN